MDNSRFRSMILCVFLWNSISLQLGLSAEPCNDCEVSDREADAADQFLFLNEGEKSDALIRHLPFGIPKDISTNRLRTLLVQDNYVIYYDGELRVPVWVAYRLKNDDLQNPLQREDCFRPDPRIPQEQSANCSDYDEPVFDRGHMVPSADMRKSIMAMVNTCVFTNISPQHAKFNRMIWAYLEAWVRDWATEKDEIYIMMGTVFDSDLNGVEDSLSMIEFMDPSERVAVPSHFYKVVLYERPNGYIETMAFLLPNDTISPRKKDSKEYLLQKATSIDSLESLTGIDFLTDLHERKEFAIERFRTSSIWPTR